MRRALITSCFSGLVWAASGAVALAAPSVAIHAAPEVQTGAPVDVVYTGLSEPGTDYPFMTLRAYYERNLRACAGNPADMRNRVDARSALLEFPEAGVFRFASQLAFPDPGAYRICAYLDREESGASGTTMAVAESVVAVSRPCRVPNVKGLRIGPARRKLKRAGCGTGSVASRGKGRLVVVSQSRAPGKSLPSGTKVNLRLRPQR